jgi:hypothetical protein
MKMQTLRLSLAALAGCAALLAGCAIAQPDPEPVAQGQIPEPSMQKCATTTGSRIATTCSNLVKSTSNTAAVREMQRHAPMNNSN